MGHCGPVMPYYIIGHGYHWSRLRFVTCKIPNHYPNRCWFIMIFTFNNKLKWNYNQNSKSFLHENVFKNVISKIMAICVSHGNIIYPIKCTWFCCVLFVHCVVFILSILSEFLWCTDWHCLGLLLQALGQSCDCSSASKATVKKKDQPFTC